MGERAPKKHAVRSACDELSSETIVGIIRQLNGAYGSGPLNPRADPWRKAQELLLKARNRP
jgi:hypothetical protein